jgi:DNA-binding FadR family transcriptional regulator
MSAKYVRDFFDVWAPIATTLGRLASTRATDEQLLAITRTLDQFAADLASPVEVQMESVPRRSAMVFQQIIDAADNEHLSALCRRLSGVNERIFRMAYQKDPAIGRTMSVIVAQADAWRSRDPDQVAHAAERYVANARAQVLRLL